MLCLLIYKKEKITYGNFLKIPRLEYEKNKACRQQKHQKYFCCGDDIEIDKSMWLP